MIGLPPMRALDDLAQRTIQRAVRVPRRPTESRFFRLRSFVVHLGWTAMTTTFCRCLIRIARRMTMAMQQGVGNIHRLPARDQQGGQNVRQELSKFRRDHVKY